MDEWSEIRRRVLVEGLSKRAACRAYGLHGRTLQKMLEHSKPPGYRAAQPRAKRKIGRFLELIAEILKQDQAAPRKQPHTKQRIFDRLKAEGYTGARWPCTPTAGRCGGRWTPESTTTAPRDGRVVIK